MASVVVRMIIDEIMFLLEDLISLLQFLSVDIEARYVNTGGARAPDLPTLLIITEVSAALTVLPLPAAGPPHVLDLEATERLLV